MRDPERLPDPDSRSANSKSPNKFKNNIIVQPSMDSRSDAESQSTPRRQKSDSVHNLAVHSPEALSRISRQKLKRLGKGTAVDLSLGTFAKEDSQIAGQRAVVAASPNHTDQNLSEASYREVNVKSRVAPLYKDVTSRSRTTSKVPIIGESRHILRDDESLRNNIGLEDGDQELRGELKELKGAELSSPAVLKELEALKEFTNEKRAARTREVSESPILGKSGYNRVLQENIELKKAISSLTAKLDNPRIPNSGVSKSVVQDLFGLQETVTKFTKESRMSETRAANKINELQEAVKAREITIQYLEHRLEVDALAASKKIEELKEEFLQTTNAKDDLALELQSTIQDLSNQIQLEYLPLSIEKDALSTANKIFEEKLSSAFTKIPHLEAKAQKSQLNLTKAGHKIKQLLSESQKSISEKENENLNLKLKLEELERKIEQECCSISERNSVIDSNAALQHKLSVNLDILEELKSKLDTVELRSKEKDAESQKIIAKKDSLNVLLKAKVTKQSNQMKTDYVLKSINIALADSHKKIENELQSYLTEAEKKLKDQVAAYSKLISQKDETISKLKENLEMAKELVPAEDVAKANKNLKSKIEENALIDLQDTNKDLNERLQEAQDQITSNEERTKDEYFTIEEFDSAALSYVALIDELKVSLSEKEDSILSLQEELCKSQERIAEFEWKIEAEYISVEAHEYAIEQLSPRLRQRSYLESNNQNLKDQLTKAQSQLSVLEKRISTDFIPLEGGLNPIAELDGKSTEKLKIEHKKSNSTSNARDQLFKAQTYITELERKLEAEYMSVEEHEKSVSELKIKLIKATEVGFSNFELQERLIQARNHNLELDKQIKDESKTNVTEIQNMKSQLICSQQIITELEKKMDAEFISITSHEESVLTYISLIQELNSTINETSINSEGVAPLSESIVKEIAGLKSAIKQCKKDLHSRDETIRKLQDDKKSNGSQLGGKEAMHTQLEWLAETVNTRDNTIKDMEGQLKLIHCKGAQDSEEC